MLSIFTVIFSIPSVIFAKYMDSCTNRCISAIAMKFLNCSKVCCWREVSTTILMPSSNIPSVTVMSSQNVQYSGMSCCPYALANGQPFMVYAISTCKCSSFWVTSHISCVDMHSGISLQVSIALVLSFMLKISLSLFLQWISCNSQSIV